MEKIKKLYEKYKDMNDCENNEFIDLYDTLLVELNSIESDYVNDLKNMYNHEYCIVKNWCQSEGSETVYNENRIKGFIKMKRILALLICID